MGMHAGKMIGANRELRWASSQKQYLAQIRTNIQQRGVHTEIRKVREEKIGWALLKTKKLGLSQNKIKDGGPDENARGVRKRTRWAL